MKTMKTTVKFESSKKGPFTNDTAVSYSFNAEGLTVSEMTEHFVRFLLSMGYVITDSKKEEIQLDVAEELQVYNEGDKNDED